MNKNSGGANGKKGGGGAHPTGGSHGKGTHHVKRGQRNYVERTTTVRFLSASSGLSYCTKLIKVQKTKAKAEGDSCLCPAMEEKGSCPRGDQCPLVHVSRDDLWLFIHPQSHGVPGAPPDHLVYNPGFFFACFSSDFNLYYDALPSQAVTVTEGSKRFIDVWNESGANMRDKFKLCPTYTHTGFCASGAACEDLHAAADKLAAVESRQTHIGTADAIARFHYARLPAHVRVRVLPLPTSVPGGKKRAEKDDEQRQQLLQQQADTIFSGGDVLVTEGATRYEEEFKKNHNEVLETTKFQNCVHFVQNQMCRNGALCGFLHIVPVVLALAPVPADARPAAGTTPAAGSPTKPQGPEASPPPSAQPAWAEGCGLAEPRPVGRGQHEPQLRPLAVDQRRRRPLASRAGRRAGQPAAQLRRREPQQLRLLQRHLQHDGEQQHAVHPELRVAHERQQRAVPGGRRARGPGRQRGNRQREHHEPAGAPVPQLRGAEGGRGDAL
ncbi:hypothetical protein STCU_10535 [Strigomonas culicis]|uniref:C3H1-type domain-containing protein n=1 Tax=Strigomonas culicis TaxID=28005 RepID=S9TMI6_9TRYP|nr:hypothetical protein STCU_10535 [Strigomonas culicis]|eukprot:EPY17548.1 hypothetical protein STCU_10535 [Strigomonas culicis]